MLTATQPLGATLSPSYGPSSFSSSRVSRAAGQQWAPRRGVSKVSCTRTSRFMYGQAIGTVDREETGLVPCCDEEGAELITLKATVKVQLKQEDSTNPEKVADMASRPWLLLEYFSSELDRGETGREKYTEQHEAKYSRTDRTISAQPSFIYEATLKVPYWFGAIGAVVVKNSYNSEVYISDIKVDVDDPYESSAVTFHCDSWVAFNPGHNERIFFPLKSYIPSQTPKGVEFLRRKELEAIRGDGHGERMGWERIYDYDVYNDLGDPDKDANAKRPVLGGRRRPYPRRCRTGRPRCKTDWRSETRANGGDIYVPRDEAFTERKAGAFNTKKVLSGLAAFTTKKMVSDDKKRSFPSLAAIDALYEDGYKNQPTEQEDNLKGYLQELLEEQVQLLLKGETEKVKEDLLKLLKYQTPEIHDKDKLAWFRDEEFARQTLAGVNPLSIELVTEFPIFSKLDEETYGPGDSLITKELIEKEINGVMTAEEAVERKRLFMLDYHDMFLPYVHTVRELDDTTLYASRTLFFLTDLEEGRELTEEAKGTLRPIAIELTRPKSPNLPQWRQVFTPGSSVTGSWLWQLAKTHVLAHDTGYHQLISHWLRTHCCVEPYVIAAHRQLSQMHPIYRLLHPHFRFTMEINAQARNLLINADGFIESSFSPGKHSMELSSGIYDKFWRFDMEALPADLLRRGMAVELWDGSLDLTIKDYPYANDGLLIWNSIKEWVSDYVEHYYPCVSDITGDEELRAFWTEVRTRGHPDKQDEWWWPELVCYGSLIQILTTIIWVASGHHAAVNFSQYPYAGYFPNHPTIARRNMPTEAEGCEDMRSFVQDPVKTLLDTFPSQYHSTLVLPVLNLLSSHSPGEEYMGTHSEPEWMAEPEVRAAFLRFNGRMMEIAEIIDCRNRDMELKNRHGPGVVPYVLLKPSYGDPKDMKSVMEMGIPNSISI